MPTWTSSLSLHRMPSTTTWTNIKGVDERARHRQTGMDLESHRCIVCKQKSALFSFLKSAFCLSTSPKAPCWRFPILAMTMSERARHCSFGLTKTFLFLCVRVYWCYATHVLHSSNNYFPKAVQFVYNWQTRQQIDLSANKLCPLFGKNFNIMSGL